MDKKRVKGKKKSVSVAKKSANVDKPKPKKSKNSEKILIENFVALQKVMTHLSERFDKLSKEISKLLEIFEISAKSFMEKDINLGESKEESQEIAKKLEELIDQNKTIARGLTLLYESNHNHSSSNDNLFQDDENGGSNSPMNNKMAPPRREQFRNSAPPNRGPPNQTKEARPDMGQYQKSISSE